MTFQLILPASGQANQKCVKIVTESVKADLCIEHLNTLFQNFQGEERFRQATDTIQKPIKREKDWGGGKETERNREQNRYKEKNVTYFGGFNNKLKLSRSQFMSRVLH